MKEIWKDIPNYEGYYQVSNMGRIKALPRETGNQYAYGRFMTPQINRQGYYYLDLSIKKVRTRFNIHRLVALTFIENPLNKPCVNHIDGNKLNNSVDNLEWCSHSENTRHALRTGLFNFNWNEEHKRKVMESVIKRCSKPIVQIKDGIIINHFQSSAQAGRELGFSQGNISNAIKTKTKAYGYYWEYDK